jgi:hypothetical protein
MFRAVAPKSPEPRSWSNGSGSRSLLGFRVWCSKRIAACSDSPTSTHARVKRAASFVELRIALEDASEVVDHDERRRERANASDERSRLARPPNRRPRDREVLAEHLVAPQVAAAAARELTHANVDAALVVLEEEAEYARGSERVLEAQPRLSERDREREIHHAPRLARLHRAAPDHRLAARHEVANDPVGAIVLVGLGA